MRSGNFELEIVGGQEAPDTCRVEMRHRQVYQITLANLGIVDCQAIVTIDGDRMGTWIVAAGESLVVEGPEDERGCFTFYRAGSEEARTATPADARESGIVSVWFVPAFDDFGDEEPDSDGGSLFSLSAASAISEEDESAGVTGFTGQVKQNPPPTGARHRWDLETAVLVELRLVSEPIPEAEYEQVRFAIYDCPDCKQQSKVPSDMGALRIKCPACFCQFIRTTS